MSEPIDTGLPELAPSNVRVEAPNLVRILCGFGGLFAITLGIATMVFAPQGRGIFPFEWGYLFSALGAALLVLHAIRDGDYEIRRAYGSLGALLLVIAVGIGVYPHKPEGSEVAVVGGLLLPWGLLFGFLALIFLANFARHETEEPYLSWVQMALLGTGGLLVAGSAAIGLLKPDAMAGAGGLLGLLGLGYLLGYFTVTDTSNGLPFRAASVLGIAGAALAIYAVARTIYPTVLFDGPQALLKANKQYDSWNVMGRALVIVLGLSGLFALRAKSLPLWPKLAIAGFGGMTALAFFVASFTTVGTTPPSPFLIPGGLILLLMGLACLAVSAGYVVDTPLVVLTRREFASLFFSPIAYIVLFMAAMVTIIGHWMFLGEILSAPAIPEPILKSHVGLDILSCIIVIFAVPALTMRSFSEESRTGTLEVVLTAPVDEWPIVLSKLIPTVIGTMLLFVPGAVCLVALWVAGGVPFDYRPLLSYYLCVLVCAIGFCSIGVFFSSLTKNQIVAAVLTFAVLFVMFLIGFLARLLSSVMKDSSASTTSSLGAILRRIGFLELWQKALEGQLDIAAIVLHLSIAALFLFATTKVLEWRKWN